MAIFPTRGENSNSCEISHFHVLKQTVKVQFSLDVLGKNIFIAHSEATNCRVEVAMKNTVRINEIFYRKISRSKSLSQKRIHFSLIYFSSLKLTHIAQPTRQVIRYTFYESLKPWIFTSNKWGSPCNNRLRSRDIFRFSFCEAKCRKTIVPEKISENERKKI